MKHEVTLYNEQISNFIPKIVFLEQILKLKVGLENTGGLQLIAASATTVTTPLPCAIKYSRQYIYRNIEEIPV